MAAVAALLALPAAAGASPGGVAVPAPEADEPAAADGFTVTAKRSVWLGKRISIRGQAPSPHAKVKIQAKTPGGAWRTIGAAEAGDERSFSTKWAPESPGRFALRAVLVEASGSSSSAGPASSSHELLVFRPLIATWYGPGFFGRETACGMKLTKETKGVAHRSLPCGTKVAISYGGRETVAPVIDRGPFANGADYDLTQATARELDVKATVKVGALPLRDR